jgi:ATP-dependent DNA helicase RecQ
VDQRFGQSHIIAILRGSESEKVMDYRHHKLSTYAIGKDYSTEEWRHYANEFRRQGLVVQDHQQYSVLKITRKGWSVLKSELAITVSRPKHIERIGREAVELPPANRALFEELRKLRRQLAEKQNVPPYVIFNDYTLKEIAARVPIDGPQFLTISGVGEVKAKQYGVEFLRLIRNYRSQHQKIAPMAEIPRAPREAKGGDSAYETLALFRKGHAPKKIAELRGLAISTISGHIASLIQNGDIESLDMLVHQDKIEPIRAAFGKIGYATLTQIKEQLGDAYTFEELRFVRAYDERNK